MADTHTRIGTIAKLERLRNSFSGNPRYTVILTDGAAYKTQVDASINYALPNSEFQGVPVVFTIENDQITYARPARYALFKNGQRHGTEEFETENDALKRLSKAQAMSWDWAMKYEGWEIRPV